MVHVFDDVLPDPGAYRVAALRLPFGSVTFGSVTFHGISPCVDSAVRSWLVEKNPELNPTLTFFRRSPFGQVEPNFVHDDTDMGDWTAIYYMNDRPANGDGTDFWTGDTRTMHIGAAFNRLIWFPSSMPHSRALFDNYGEGDDARLIQVMFGSGTWQ